MDGEIGCFPPKESGMAPLRHSRRNSSFDGERVNVIPSSARNSVVVSSADPPVLGPTACLVLSDSLAGDQTGERNFPLVLPLMAGEPQPPISVSPTVVTDEEGVTAIPVEIGVTALVPVTVSAVLLVPPFSSLERTWDFSLCLVVSD